MRFPRYRVWAGFTLWIGGTIADIVLSVTVTWWQAKHGGPAGALSGGGFVLALAWAVLDAPADAGEER